MLNELGYKRPIYDELVTKYESRAKELFGQDVDTSDASPLGQFIRLNAYDAADVYELAEEIYFSAYVSTARGQSLDRAVTAAGITRNTATTAIHRVKFTGTPGHVIEPGFLVAKNNVTFYVTETSVLDSHGEGVTDVRCTQSGDIGNVSDIDTIVNPVIEVSDVDYMERVEQGQEAESDAELRKRFFLAQKGGGSQLLSSIEGAIARLPGVNSVAVYENLEDVPDSAGRPPHSFEVFVSGGNDTEIAQIILLKKPAGIKTFGQFQEILTDLSGKPVPIKFSRVANTAIKLKVTVNVDKYFEQDGSDKIKDNLSKHINNLQAGEDLMYTSLFGPIHSVTGVVSVTSLTVAQDNSPYVNENIVIDEAHIATNTTSNIEVNVVWI